MKKALLENETSIVRVNINNAQDPQDQVLVGYTRIVAITTVIVGLFFFVIGLPVLRALILHKIHDTSHGNYTVTSFNNSAYT